MAKNERRKRNAFGMLMSRPSKSRFVVCPAGCGRHVSACNVNRHLDECMSRENEKATVTQTQESPSSIPKRNCALTEELLPSSMAGERMCSVKEFPVVSSNPNQEDVTVTPEKAMEIPPKDDEAPVLPSASEISESNSLETSDPSSTALFSRMMQSAKTTFAESHPVRQTLHLDETSQVRLLSKGENDIGKPCWVESINLRGRSSVVSGTAPEKIELTVAVSIEQQPEEKIHRWVEKHSRLSVPVLKSILQKSIRRKRPLPAVRVAMELLDKAPGELLRRLPIIAVEDSTLHPDTPLLVCLMILSTKGFRIPTFLLRRVLEIVYEIASCPCQDFIARAPDPEQQSVSLSSASHILVWSLLARAAYGGMNGDVNMLQAYAQVWNYRFIQVAPVPASAELDGVSTWQEVPSRVHTLANAKVQELVPPSIPFLQFQDITTEGVDFHCSNIVEHLGSDKQLVNLCHDLLVLSAQELPREGEREVIMFDLWRSAIWNCSAGVNRRRPLLPFAQKCLVDHNHRTMWSQLLAPKVQAFQETYVRSRLSR